MVVVVIDKGIYNYSSGTGAINSNMVGFDGHSLVLFSAHAPKTPADAFSVKPNARVCDPH
jgi:hypothetical protein